MLPSASLGAPMENGRPKALYEPVHGSAPDIAGQGKPTRSPASSRSPWRCGIPSTSGIEADRLEKAVEAVLADGLRTADLLGEEGKTPVSTAEMGDAIVAKLAAAERGTASGHRH
jgi:3-isopropylmalate dehydrogenase